MIGPTAQFWKFALLLRVLKSQEFASGADGRRSGTRREVSGRWALAIPATAETKHRKARLLVRISRRLYARVRSG
jgi:hypothetical protein